LIETHFDLPFIARLARKEKQIQQSYRPIIGVHKWFARRPGSVFRGLLLAEFATGTPLEESYYKGNSITGTIIDPFMGGGTPVIEANRVGLNVIGCDINPMAWWITRQELASLSLPTFRDVAENLLRQASQELSYFYRTTCLCCGRQAEVKYFLWVKQSCCPYCGEIGDLFPGYLVAANDRHVEYLYYCPHCHQLAGFAERVSSSGQACPHCGQVIPGHGNARRGKYTCNTCGGHGTYPCFEGPPSHRLFAIEYHCKHCKSEHEGRFFKVPDGKDLERFQEAAEILAKRSPHLPESPIAVGDETRRLLKWGYGRFTDLFNARQLFGLSTLADLIRNVPDGDTRHSLATIFSDFLRYQNMLARYDTYALKCQDIFSVHGFPVGLIQCENNLLGIPRVGSGSFVHFIEKYLRAKQYCESPFEIALDGKKKRTIPIHGERIAAQFTKAQPSPSAKREALLVCGSVEDIELRPNSLDGAFTDPPYYDNVQYSELMDFCYAWLKRFLQDEFAEFRQPSTRSERELTGNRSNERGLVEFTRGLSRVYCYVAKALKRGAPFVFTYHHNELDAYAPVVVAILDAGLHLATTIPCPAEMTASLHIHATSSSTVDSILVCRKYRSRTPRGANRTREELKEQLRDQIADDCRQLSEAGINLRQGDINCITYGRLAVAVAQELETSWEKNSPTSAKLELVTRGLISWITALADLGR